MTFLSVGNGFFKHIHIYPISIQFVPLISTFLNGNARTFRSRIYTIAPELHVKPLSSVFCDFGLGSVIATVVLCL